MPRGSSGFINDYGLRFFGYTAEELINHDVMTIVPKVEKSSGRDLDALVKDIVVHPEQYTYVPSENLTKDGRTVWVAWTNKALKDGEGNVREILAIGNDITPLKESEAALRESEEKFRTLFENNLDAVFMTRPDGSIIDANPAACDMLGWSEQEFLEIGRSSILDPEDPKFSIAFEEREKTGRVAAKELTAIRKSGERFPVEVDSVILLGDPARSFLICRDISDRKKAEEELKSSLAEKEVLLKEIHHRVKNNMQVISSLVSLQTSVTEDTATQDILQDIAHRVRSMAMIHEKIYQTADLANLDFADYTRSLLNYLWGSHATEVSGTKLITDLESVYFTVNIAVPCGLILNELVSNALKHAFKGRDSGEVIVTLRKSGRHIILRVRDSGIGLPPALDWRQAGSLGLRLIQMLAKQLHATVEVTRDEGTEFSIEFEGPEVEENRS